MNSVYLGFREANSIYSAFDEEDSRELIEARERGFREGYATANERIAQIMSAEGISGNGKRMTVALDLAVKAPDMTADAVADYVRGMTFAAAPSISPGEAYEESRSGLLSAGVVLHGMAQSAAARKPGARGGLLNSAAVYSARNAQKTTPAES